jgi:Ca2+-binding EF-hand superfamily protein
MSYVDFLRTLTPFNYCEIKSNEWREAYVEKHSDYVNKIMRIADPDGDKAVDFTEFLFFITIQQMPIDVLENIFETKKDGKMVEKEFAKALNTHRKSTKLG